jgi:hypothetical protein
MKRNLGPILAMGLVAVLGVQASAQAQEGELSGGSVQGGSTPFNLPSGGFGLGYTQVLPSDGYVLDRYWQVVATSSAGTMAPADAPAQATEPVQRVARARAGKPARTARSVGIKARARKTDQVASQTTEPLPSGSLYWSGAAGVSLYSPTERYASYGYGYDRSPHGTTDYGFAYQGYYLGY